MKIKLLLLTLFYYIIFFYGTQKDLCDQISVFFLTMKVSGDQIFSEQNVFVCVLLVILEFDCNWSPFTFTFGKREAQKSVYFFFHFCGRKKRCKGLKHHEGK